ncbi:metabotropic glutamate receptor 3 [Plakobranchus ocellatus]|uniref:Metabotropic glutamate receptor 3 n=1 Tax=Plakobranchus ocellatus TaxID=259542 RepID=A0AAV4BKK2_9GAST|nr:metabotropic glutamate receptor 3 [Plakobranchus ocellatus]
MQVFEATRFTISALNRGYIPGVNFGMRVFDTCKENSVALKALQELYPQTSSRNPFCTQGNNVMLGILGTMFSSTSIPAAKYAATLPVSMISPRAMAPALSDKTHYPTFLRTLPSNAAFAKTVIELLRALQWEENILLIYTDEDYGRSGLKQLLEAAHNRGVCFAKAIAVDPALTTRNEIVAVLNAVGSKTYAAGVLVMTSYHTEMVLDALAQVQSLTSTQWILSDLDITSDQNSLLMARGSMIVAPDSPTIDEFRTFFAQEVADITLNGHLENPWFYDWYEEKYNCWIGTPRAGLSQCNPQTQANLEASFVQSPYVLPTIRALAAYAEAVRQRCQTSAIDPCVNRLRSVSASDFHDTLKNLDVTIPNNFPIAALRGERIKFDANGDLEVYDFAVYNYNNRLGTPIFEKIAQYTNNALTLSRAPVLYDSARTTSLATNPVAPCPTPQGCINCLKPEIPIVFRYNPGDLVIGSLTNGHMPGRFPFTCGEGVTSRLAALVAAEWAATRFRTLNPGKLQQVTLGSLVVDVCPDSLVAGGFISDLLSGNNRFLAASGDVITAENILGFVDHTDGQQASVITPVLANYMLPEIQTDSVASMEEGSDTSMMMGSDHNPFMIQAVPNDHMLYEAISSLLLRMGWTYVQVVTHGSGMYQAAAHDFMMTAGRHGICVVGMVDNLDSQAADRYTTALNRLRSRPNATVVVVIADMGAVRGLLGAISAQGAVGQLQLVAGTEDWARNPEYVRSLETAASGSLMVGLEMSEITTYTNWLRTLTTSDIVGHPFMSELFEITNQCSLGPSTTGSYSRVCGPTDSFNSNPDSPLVMGKIPYVIQSVFTMADKLHEVIVEVCNDPNYSGLCPAFRSSVDIGRRLDEKLQNTAKLNNGYGIKDGKSTTDFIFYQYRGGVYNRFAQYSNENRRLVTLNMNQLTSLPSAPACGGPCVECQYLFALQSGVHLLGDWLVAGIFSVSNPGPEQYQPYICGDIRTSNGPQYTTAMMYAIEQVNSGMAPVSVKGVTFGGIALDHCDNPGRANLLTSSLYSGYLQSMGVDENHILSWLTDNTAATHEAEALLDPLGVAVVSPSATSTDLMDYATFHRTIQGDRTVASALVKIIKSLGYPYFQVVYSDSAYGEAGLQTLKDVAQSEGICVTNSLKVSSTMDADADGVVQSLVALETDVVVFFTGASHTQAVINAISRNSVARNVLFLLLAEPFENIVSSVASNMRHKVMSLRLQTEVLQGYNNFINNSPVSNPYFAHYYMQLMQCNLPGFSTYATSCPEPLQNITMASGYAPDHFILSTINAVYATVDALDRTVRERCGDSYTQPCQAFLADPEMRRRFNMNLANVNFVDEAGNNFRFLDREGNVIYDILQSNNQGGYVKVGTYAGVSLDLESADTAVYSSVSSQCSPPCLSCIMQSLNFSHTPGDIYLAGVFDVHESSVSPFTCGGIKTLHGFLLLEAFHYALNQVNGKEGQFANILPGVRLGGIGIDACSSKIRGGYLVGNINNGYTTLARDGVVIAPAEIDAYIGSYESRSSIYLAEILNDLEIPQISYAAGNPDLSDDRYYPFFYRTVPSDNNMVQAILKFLDMEDIRYVQVVFEETANAIETKNYFMEMASKYSICVAQAVNYPDISTISAETANAVVAQLIEKPAANTVVTFLNANLINSMLQAVMRSERARGKLRFFGSDDWADNQDAIISTGQEAINSVTIKLDSDDVEGFERYINARTLANTNENPWFAEYFQAIHNCYVSKVNTMGYPRPCPLTPSDTINQPNYQQDQGVAYVMDAVYAAAFGLHETLLERCGNDYTAVCQAYRSNENRRTTLRDKLKNVTFMDPLGAPFQFVQRSGNYGYRYYSIDSGVRGVATYNQIGTYNMSSMNITVASTYQNRINSNCERKDACAECPLIRDNSQRYAYFNGPNSIATDATTVVAFFDIHKQGVDPYRCGPINPEGFQQFLAFFYALERVIQSNSVRFVAIDTCSNSLRVDQDLYGLLAGDGLCNSKFDSTYPLAMRNLGSVITLGEPNTMAASRVLEVPGVTYVSPNALSPTLDDKPHLLRSVAPTSAMMKALADLMKELSITYGDVVYEDNMDGFHTLDRLAYYSYDARVCLASNLAVSEDDSPQDIETTLASLSSDSGSKVVVLIGSHVFAKRVLDAANRLGIADDYLWVLAGDWEPTPATMGLLGIGSDVQVLTVHRRTWPVRTFTDHVNQLDYSNVHNPNGRTNIPSQWFDEFYQLLFNCTLPNSERPLGQGRAVCATDRLFSQVDWTPDPYVLNIVTAAYSVANGLRDLGPNLGNDMPSRMIIRDRILDVQWNMLESSNNDFDTNLIQTIFEFDKENRWWDQGHVFTYWSGSTGNLEFITPVEPTDLDTLKARLGDFTPSQCAETLQQGYCGCEFTDSSASPLVMAPMGYQPSDHRNYYEYSSSGDKSFEWPVWTIPVCAVTVAGIIMTIILFLILICAYPVRTGTSVLGYLSIIGILCIYGINFAFFVHATDAVCGIRRFLMGVVYMIALAPLLVKAIDNWRYSHVDFAEGRYSGISSACALLMMALGLVLIQCIIPIMWLILRHPTASQYFPVDSYTRHDNWWCDPPDDYDLGLVLSFAFVLFVLIITSGFSALAFDSERNNRESRWILFSCVATGGCFLVWMVVTTNAGPPYRDPAVAIANVVNATLLVITMPLRKCILMFRAIKERGKEKDTRVVYNRNGVPYEFNSTYDNPTYSLNEYDNTFIDSKSEDF